MTASTAEFVARVRRLPSVLEQTLAVPLPSLTSTDWTFTGIGTSEAVARFAAETFQHALGARAMSAPLTGIPRTAPSTLVLISQELSPNAALGLAAAPGFSRSLCVTSVTQDDPRLTAFRANRGEVWTLAPHEERGLLVRVMGPPAAALALLRLGASSAGRSWSFADVPRAVERSLATGFELARTWPLTSRRAALVAQGWYARTLELLAWTWMESWFVEPPPVWDVLQLAHGPLQALERSPLPWLTLRRPEDQPELWRRFERCTDGHAGPRVALEATLEGPLAFFEHLGAVLGLLAGVLERAPTDLEQWPGKGLDRPLYEHPAL